MRLITSVAFALSAAAVRPAPAQQSPSASDAVRAAHDAVGDLAHARLSNLPRGAGGLGPAAAPCPTHIGRICHWPEAEDAPPPPPEASSVVAARARAIALLGAAATARPTDGWIAGQRVRLLVDAGQPRAALDAARNCRADRAWCLELAGYALHRAGDYGAADSVFAAALGSMTADARCRWNYIASLLDGALQRRYTSETCAQRDSLARQIWWLAAPLYLVSAVDARTEWDARRTRAIMAGDEPRSELFGWDDDARQTALRYGWSTWYSQDPPLPGAMTQPAIVGHERGGSYYFLPDERTLDSIGRSDSTDWRLNDARAPAAYAPAYLRSLHALPVRLARFRRGDSLAIVAQWDARGDTTLAGAGLRAGLFVGASPDGMRSISRADASSSGALALTVAARPALASVELLDAVHARAARARLGVVPLADGDVQLSDLLLLRAAPAREQPTIAELAALGGPPDARAPAIVYYELYTPPSDTGRPVAMDLRVEPRRSGWARRLAARLHLARPPSAVTLRWAEHASVGGTTARALHLDLSRLTAGAYDVRIVARDGHGVRLATSSATVHVRDRL